jgi:uncharacterized protein YjbJ (UPF0337 family)
MDRLVLGVVMGGPHNETAVNVKGVSMSEHDKADEARKGLFDSVKGKAKEVAGAMTGNDSLTAEGQLEQTQARERKDANSIQAIADAEAEQARAKATEAKLEGAEERIAVDARTASVESSIVTQQAAQKAAAEQAAQHESARAATQAEIDAQREVERAEAQERVDVRAAASDATEAVDEHQAALDEAADARAAADEARQRAEKLTENADLP